MYVYLHCENATGLFCQDNAHCYIFAQFNFKDTWLIMQKTDNSLTDWEIVQIVLQGDVNLYEHLLERYKNYVFKIVSQHMATQFVEEVAHEVFVRAYKSLANFKNEGKFKNWLLPITLRTCYDFWRTKYKNPEVPISSLSERHLEWLDKFTANQAMQHSLQDKNCLEAKEILAWVFAKLPPADRMVLELIYLEGLTCKEAGKLLGWSVANVKIRSYRCRKKLKILLEKHI